MGNEEMFLSPRVLDAGAFARYSEILKSIITQASTQGRTLEDFSTDAQAMIKRCNDTSEAINKRMQAGVRMLKMIDERADRTDQLLAKVQASLPDSQTISVQIDQLIQHRMRDAQLRIDEMTQLAEERIRVAQVAAAQAIESSETHVVRLSELSGRIDKQLALLDSKIHETQIQSNDTIAQLTQATNDAQRRIESSIESVLNQAHNAGEHLATKIDEASNLTDARIAELNESIEPVLNASQQAMRTLGMDPENPVFEDSPLARIEHLVERGETQTASLDRVYRQLEDLQSQAEGVRSAFGAWLVDAADELDVLESRKERIVGPISNATQAIRELAPDIEDKLELASTKLTQLQFEQRTLRETIQASSTIAGQVTERMSNHSGQLQALLDGSLHKLSTRVEQAGVWLGTLIQRAESLGMSMPGAGKLELAHDTPIARMNEIESLEMDTFTIDSMNHVQGAEIELQSQILNPRASNTPTPIQNTNQLPTQTPSNTPTTNPEPSMKSAMKEEPIQTPVRRENPLGTRQPPQLPIDSFSFDGASFVIEHKPRENRPDDLTDD